MTPSSLPMPSPVKAFGRSQSQCKRWILAGFALVGLLCLLSLIIGSRDVGWDDVVAAMSGHDDTISQASVVLRIPRTVLALLSGAALGLAGTVMQGVTRNPLADPGILGVNTGAALAVVIGVAWFNMTSAQAFVWVAIAGAGCAAALVYTISSMGRGGATPLKLALTGAASSMAFSSLVTAVVLPRNDIAGGIRSWQIGGVGGADFERINAVLPFLTIGLVISLLSARKLNSLALGDDLAAGLGERVALVRVVAVTGAILLCGATTAACGPIGFVGLVVPHLCRQLVGHDYQWLLPLAALGGASLLVLADIVGRVAARPAELDVGIVTALVGAPFFIWVVRQQRIREL